MMKKRRKKKPIAGVPADHPIVKKKIKKSLDLSVKEGSMAAISSGLGASYFGPFALFLGATASQMSLLHGMASLLPSITQLYSSHLIEKHSRKKTVLFSIAMDLILLVLIGLLGVLYVFGSAGIWTLLSLIGLFYLGVGIRVPAWFSWMGSLIPENKRGKYISRRTKIASIFGLVTMLASAILLDFIKKIGISRGQEVLFTSLGFALFFIVSVIFGLLSFRLLAKQYEPRLKIKKSERESFWKFLKSSNKSTLGKYGWFNFASRIAFGVSAPFYVIFLLRDYNFDYFWYMGFIAAGVIFQIAFLPLMGKASDKFGNIAIVRSCSAALVLVPLLVAASVLIPSKIIMILFLVTVPQIFAGFGMAGLNLATNNYLYDSTVPQKRSYALAHLNLLIGIGFFVGTLIASVISHLGISFVSISIFGFLLSTALRFSVLVFGQRALKEVREVAPFSPAYFLHEIHPLRGTMHQIHHINNVGSKIIHHI